MIKNKVATLAVTAALGLSVGLVGCAGAESGTVDTATDTTADTTSSVADDKDSTSSVAGDEKKDDKDSKKKGLFSAAGYQGKLEDGKSFVYIEMGEDTVIISLTDEEHEGDDAETYSGKAVTDEAGKTTVTDEDSGKSITFTLTENEDGSMDVDVEGHGKGSLQGYEGNIFSVIGSLAEDDAKAEEAETSSTSSTSSATGMTSSSSSDSSTSTDSTSK